MTPAPKTVSPDLLASAALELINASTITTLFVVENGRPSASSTSTICSAPASLNIWLRRSSISSSSGAVSTVRPSPATPRVAV